MVADRIFGFVDFPLDLVYLGLGVSDRPLCLLQASSITFTLGPHGGTQSFNVLEQLIDFQLFDGSILLRPGQICNRSGGRLLDCGSGFTPQVGKQIVLHGCPDIKAAALLKAAPDTSRTALNKPLNRLPATAKKKLLSDSCSWVSARINSNSTAPAMSITGTCRGFTSRYSEALAFLPAP
jgi:hypothetical protein